MAHSVWRRLTFVCALLWMAHPAQAEWYEASSDHFVIYADDSERDIRQFAENLERYHSAMAFLIERNLEKPSPSNRVVIYVVGSEQEIRDLAGGKSRTVAGFYIPRAGASRAFVQDIRNQRGYPDFSTIVLLHEYAHHFLMSASRFATPRWQNEGAAEFFAAATFRDDGSIQVGRAAQHRAAELVLADPVPVRKLLDAPPYNEDTGAVRNAFYGKSWLLYHYLTFSAERADQLRQYQINLRNGMTSLAAGEAAFGDLDVLERELKAYRRSRLNTIVLTPEKLSASPVTLRKLPPGEAEMLPLQMRSQRGVNREQANQILTEARAIAARHPSDSAVLAALAEAEYDAGNDAEAVAAADRAIAIDPSRTNAYVQKGFALFRQARAADDKPAAFKAAMQPFEALNKLENDHPLPLMYFYRSFAERNAKPPESARAALERASQLAPFDPQLQLNTGMMLIREGQNALAREYLAPLAANPHGGQFATRAKQLIAVVADVPDGTVVDVSNLPEEVETPDLSDAGG
jgi:tetratricopeptide (TPR) repeat protein